MKKVGKIGKRETKSISKRTILSGSMVLMVLVCLGLIFGFTYGQNNEEEFVLKVNGESIEIGEFKLMLQENKAKVYNYFYSNFAINEESDFWVTPYGGTRPVDMAKETAENDIIRIKIQQILFKEKEIVKDISYSGFEKSLQEENKRRIKAVNNGQPIYGPEQYDANTYYYYMLSNYVIELKEKLTADGEISYTEEALLAFYKSIKDQLYLTEGTVKVNKIFVSFIDDTGHVNLSQKEDFKVIFEKIKLDIENGLPIEDTLEKYYRADLPEIKYEQQIFDDTTARYDTMAFPELRNEVIQLKAGEFSQVIEERSHFFIVNMIEKSGQGYLPYEDIKENVRLKYIDDAYEKLIDRLVSEATVESNLGVYQHIGLN